MKNHTNTAYFALLSFAIASLLVLSACGKKEPPIPPRQALPAVVSDLNASVTGDTVTLTWNLPSKKIFRNADLLGFIVYRAKTAIIDEPCADCPILFKRIKDVLVGDAQSGVMAFTETLEKGYQYTYKVISYADNGAVSEESNFVELTH